MTRISLLQFMGIVRNVSWIAMGESRATTGNLLLIDPSHKYTLIIKPNKDIFLLS